MADRMPTSHRARRYHLQQHEQGEHQRHAGECVEPEFGDEIGFDQPDRGLHHHDRYIRQGQTQDGAGDRRLQQHLGSRVQGSAPSVVAKKVHMHVSIDIYTCVCTY
jgi:hypothetical protein